MVKQIIRKKFNILFSSDPANGATNTTAAGDRFDVEFNPPFRIGGLDVIPDSIEMAVIESKIWFTILNIEAGVNDKLYITDNAGVPQILTFPSGLYSLDDVQATSEVLLQNLGLPANLFEFSPDYPTSTTVLRINYLLVSMDFTQVDTLNNLFNFPVAVIGPFAVVPTNSISGVSAFNQFNSFQISTTLVQNGLSTNNIKRATLADIPILVAPGFQNIVQPTNPQYFNASEIYNRYIERTSFFLTDETATPLNTNNEFWSFIIEFRYDVKVEV